MAVTLSDIALKSGVSISTVSRIINKKTDKYRISADTAELVLRTANELNYRPNQLARGLRVKKTHSIGLVVPDLSNPFFAYLARSIQIEAHKLGYSMIACNTDEDLGLEVEHLNVLRDKGVDGLLVMPVGQFYDHLLPILKENLPMVLLDRCFDMLPISSVVVDNYQGSFDAIEHFIAHGHERIAIVQGLAHTNTNDGRVQGYRDALKKHGIPIEERLIVGKNFGMENGYSETKFLLRMEHPPTGIFTTSDLITIGALQAIEEAGFAVPHDVSIISFDDIDCAPFLRCPLTAVAQPKENMGEIAVRLLTEQMKRSHPIEQIHHVVLRPKLIIRASVARVQQAERTVPVPK